MAGDWIRLHRKIIESRVFSDRWLLQLWLWCLVKAGWKECWKHGRKLLPGQFVTDKRQAAEQLSVSPSRVYRGLQTFQEWGQISLEVNRRFTVVTLCNWGTYQFETEEERTTGKPQENHRKTTNEPLETSPPSSSPPIPPLITPPSSEEEGKEGEEVRAPPRKRRAFVKPTLEEVAAYCRERRNTVDAAAWMARYESNGWIVGRTPMKDWKACVRYWERQEGAFRNGRHKSGAEQTAQNLADSGFVGGLFDDEGGVRSDRALPFLGGKSGDPEGTG